MRPYVPDVGDIVWLSISPQSGHEQAGRRPAVVLSPRTYNDRAGLAVVCPMTSHAKGYPFEVGLPKALRIHGVILADHLKSVDWQARKAERIGHLPSDILQQVRAQIGVLLSIA